MLAAGAGGAVTVGGVGLWLGISKVQGERFRKPVDRSGFTPNVYLGVLPDNRVEIWVTRSEMGQGISTALPMLIVEELDADWSSVSIHQAQAGGGQDYGQLFTAASSSIASLFIELRRAGALAREMILAAAADHWGVGESECSTDSGMVIAGARRASYGELVESAARQWVPIRPELKPNEEFRLIGNSPARLDTPGKVTGEAIYGSDVHLPSMLRAVIARAPHRSQKVVRFDAASAELIPDVVGVFEVPAGIAVVATTTHAALKARTQLRIQWSEPSAAEYSTRSFADALDRASEDAAVDALSYGERPAGPYLLEAHYRVPFLAHACMEPMNCTVAIDKRGCTLWVGTQAPEGARATAARITGLPIDQVTVNVNQLGGGFGRRAGQDFVAEAVTVASRLNQPVQLFWSREDDLAHGAYRDAATIRMRAAGDEHDLTIGVQMATARAGTDVSQAGMGPVMGWDNLAYKLSGLAVRWAGVPASLPTTIWRSVGYSYNVFAMESFIDELAEKQNGDPLSLRRQLLPIDAPLRGCLEEVAKDARWFSAGDRSLGLATFDFGSTSVALIAEVEGPVSDWRVANVWCVVDCGVVVHADAAAAQIEGGIVFGLSAALFETVELNEGAVSTRNFGDYRLARMSDAPDIHVRFLPSQRYPGGLGEAGTPAAAPAVANALYRLSGERYRSLPLKG